jgi:hypothetical protein
VSKTVRKTLEKKDLAESRMRKKVKAISERKQEKKTQKNLKKMEQMGCFDDSEEEDLFDEVDE